MPDNEKNYKITIGDQAFTEAVRETNKAQLKGKIGEAVADVPKYNETLRKSDEAVAVLDRYDDFFLLKLKPEQYCGTPYGILYDPKIHTDGKNKVILRHQEIAANEFLSKHRGFGILADGVGSGKTYEAGVILSELAARGRIGRLLIVVDNGTEAYWKGVMENRFGMGKDSIKIRTKDDPIRSEDKAVIADLKYFAGQKYSPAMVFDAIVVDEAHHLCEKEYSGALRLLSEIISKQRNAKQIYCLMLSATPHSGNIGKMFPLWYFKNRHGGIPEDFKEKADSEKSKLWQDEKAHYAIDVCHGAETIMEFIYNIRKEELIKIKSAWNGKKVSDITDSEVDEIIRQAKQKKRPEKEDESVLGIDQKVAAKYNSLIGQLMIRNPDAVAANTGKSKRAVNIMLYPTDKELGQIEITINGRAVKVDTAALGVDFDKDTKADVEKKSVTYQSDKQPVTLKEFLENSCGKNKADTLFANVLLRKDEKSAASRSEPQYSRYFTKKGSDAFYRNMYSDESKKLTYYVEPVCVESKSADSTEAKRKAIFDAKIANLERIISNHKEERILIFFDYEAKPALGESDTEAEKVKKALNELNEFKGRLCEIEEFKNKKTNGIFVADKADYTESHNLQMCNVIVNFSVTPDPLSMDQRIGRIFRLGQDNDVVIYSLADMSELEGYALAYFTRIGLLTSGSGDAIIIAGSNGESSVAVRCPACGKVKMMSRSDYKKAKEAAEKQEGASALWCSAKDICREKGGKSLMNQIVVGKFVCSENPGHKLIRSATGEGYRCLAFNAGDTDNGILCNDAQAGDRKLYCLPFCAFMHCKLKTGKERNDMICPIVEAMSGENGQQPTMPDAQNMCEKCEFRKPGLCECSLPLEKDQSDSSIIKKCSTCLYAQCTPMKPQIIEFDENWEADCPYEGCGGTLKQVTAHTFAAYIRGAWDFEHDQGESFCENLRKEADRVGIIRKILK